jgi:membrane-associated phospholipid phosphatase
LTQDVIAPSAVVAPPRPIDRLLGLYAIASGLVLLLPGRPAAWPALALFHVALAWLSLGVGGAHSVRRAISRTLPRFAAWFREWYPLLLLPVFYAELEPLNIAVHGGRVFDTLVLTWEEALFRGQPSTAWAAALPSLGLSEMLHAAYLSYYLILYVPAFLVWAYRPRHEFELLVFSLLLAFVAHYLFFIFFPVEGPRYRFDAPTGGIENGFFYATAHRILESGSSRGAAFPSSHVGASAAVAVAILRITPIHGLAMFVLTLGVATGAVYGGFHYAVDAVAGLVLGAALAAIAPVLHRRIAARSGGLADPA